MAQMDPHELLLGLQTVAGNIQTKDRKPETLEELTDAAYGIFNEFLPTVGTDYEIMVSGRTDTGDIKLTAVAHTAKGKNFIEFVSKQLIKRRRSNG